LRDIFEFPDNRCNLDKNYTAMKKSICLIMTLSFLSINIIAQEIPEKDNSLLDNFIKSKISIIKETIVSDTLTKVFYGTFYKVNAGFAFIDTDQMTSSSNDIFNIKDGAIFVIESRSDSMSTLLSLVRKDFYLKTAANAKVFETALDKIYPMSDMDMEYKEHLKIANKWYFIRDKFFDSKSGYIVTLDQNSKITNISYSMEAIKK
jgi:hypothetical protein